MVDYNSIFKYNIFGLLPNELNTLKFYYEKRFKIDFCEISNTITFVHRDIIKYSFILKEYHKKIKS